MHRTTDDVLILGGGAMGPVILRLNGKVPARKLRRTEEVSRSGQWTHEPAPSRGMEPRPATG